MGLSRAVRSRTSSDRFGHTKPYSMRSRTKFNLILGLLGFYSIRTLLPSVSNRVPFSPCGVPNDGIVRSPERPRPPIAPKGPWQRSARGRSRGPRAAAEGPVVSGRNSGEDNGFRDGEGWCRWANVAFFQVQRPHQIHPRWS